MGVSLLYMTQKYSAGRHIHKDCNTTFFIKAETATRNRITLSLLMHSSVFPSFLLDWEYMFSCTDNGYRSSHGEDNWRTEISKSAQPTKKMDFISRKCWEGNPRAPAFIRCCYRIPVLVWRGEKILPFPCRRVWQIKSLIFIDSVRATSMTRVPSFV